MSSPGHLLTRDILLVEDNPADIRLTHEAFQELSIYNRLNVVEDGAAALAYLYHQAPYFDARTPDLILLDLNLPKLNGREVLATIKQDARLKRIPVVVLSTSQASEDITQSYDLHANCFVTKPTNFDQFMVIIKNIERFWLNDIKLPG